MSKEIRPPKQIAERTFVIHDDGTSRHIYHVSFVDRFQDITELQSYLESLSEKADLAGFEQETIKISNQPIGNDHWGLLPGCKSEFSGTLTLKRRQATIIDGLDENRKPKKYAGNDSWSIFVSNSGEVSSAYMQCGPMTNNPILL